MYGSVWRKKKLGPLKSRWLSLARTHLWPFAVDSTCVTAFRIYSMKMVNWLNKGHTMIKHKIDSRRKQLTPAKNMQMRFLVKSCMTDSPDNLRMISPMFRGKIWEFESYRKRVDLCSTITGWWLVHPSEKYESQLG